MRVAAALLPAKSKLNPINGNWGTIATSIHKKINNDVEKGQMVKEKPDPIVAFSKPPPLPPVLGPLVVLSLLDTYFTRDSSDD